MQHGLFGALEQRPLLTLSGPNFSGRTYLLRFITGLEADMDHRFSGLQNGTIERASSAYLGPEVYNAISGLAPTVEEELNLHIHGTKYHETIMALVEETNLSELYDRNPVTLSGGEQALLTLLCALGLTPRYLAIDCALEQVSPDIRSRIIQLMLTGTFDYTYTAFADNRLVEYGVIQDPVQIPEELRTPSHQKLLPLETLDPSTDLPIASEHCASLTLDHLNFQYPRGPAVIKDLSLSLEPGRLYALVGRNGAGKSTLAKLLCGVLRPDSGRILLGDQLYDAWVKPGQFIGYHFQNPDLQLFATRVDEEIVAGPRAQKHNETIIHQRQEALLKAFGLTRIADEHPLSLPFVIRKRVALAATLAMGCPWVILDEPTVGQDDETVQAIAQMIEQMLAKGLGVIMISHSEWFRSLLPHEVIELKRT